MRLKIGEFIADDSTDTLARGDVTTKIERRAMAVLSMLAEKPGAVRSKDEIIHTVWGDIAISDHSVAIVISQLRRAFGDDKTDPRYLKTVPKRGYSLIAPVARLDDAEAALQSAGSAHSQHAVKPRRIPLALVAAAAALLAGVGAVAFEARPRSTVIYVADFVNESGAAANDSVAFALTDMSASGLSGVDGLSVRRWRADPKTFHDDEALVLAGRVISDGDRLVAVAQIADGASAVLGGSAVTIERKGLVGAASAIVEEAARAAGRPRASGTSAAVVLNETTADYWRARFLAARRDHESLRAARDLLNGVIAERPDFAPAHAALADIYAHKTGEVLGLPRVDTFAEASRHLAAAQRIGGETSETAVTASLLLFYRDRDIDGARRLIERAVDLDRQNALAWQTRAMILSATGEDAKALASVERAEKIDPASDSILWDKVWFLYCAGRYDAALSAARRAQQVSAPNHLYLALINAALGREDEAFKAWARRATVRGLAAPPEGQGAKADYQALLAAMAADPAYDDYVPPRAILKLKAGDRAGAVADLAAAGSPRDNWMMIWASRIPDLQPLRSDPRVAPLLGGLTALPAEKPPT